MQEDDSKTFSLSLTGEGMNIQRQIDQQTALKILHAVLGGGPQNGSSVSSQVAETETLSLREYLDKIGATKKPDQIATIANYITEYEKQEDFDREAIRSRFITAREPLPGNFARDFA